MIPARKQPLAPERSPGAFPPVAAILELRRSGLTVADIARLFGVHSKAVESILDSAHCPHRRDQTDLPLGPIPPKLRESKVIVS
jgi:hypothetical protein